MVLIYWLIFIPVTIYKFSDDIFVQPETRIIQKMVPSHWQGFLRAKKFKQRLVVANFKDSAFLRIGQHAWIRMTGANGKKTFFIPSVVTKIQRTDDQNIQVTLRGEYLSEFADPFENTSRGEVMVPH
jgi:hypothetical protein